MAIAGGAATVELIEIQFVWDRVGFPQLPAPCRSPS
jgi:hypothetical protein